MMQVNLRNGQQLATPKGLTDGLVRHHDSNSEYRSKHRAA